MEVWKKTGSVQVTAGGRSYAAGLFDKDVGSRKTVSFNKKLIGKNCKTSC